jgi:hypothetical protein
MRLHAILIFILILISEQCFSEVKKLPRFGRISMDEMTAKVCPIDSNAQAYFLFDKGRSEFVYINTTHRQDGMSDNRGFQMKFTRHFRIKVLDKSMSNIANVEIPVFVSGTDKEKVLNIKAFTYNLVNGKIDKIKLDNKDIIVENKSDNWDIHKFVLPQVSEGSVIEVSYEVLSDFYFNLSEWYFQHNIPVLYSEYDVSIPQYFHYNPTMSGWCDVARKESRRSRSIEFTYHYEGDGGMQGSGRSTHKYKEEFLENTSVYYASNIPALKNETFLRTPNNYRQRLGHELAGTQYPRSPYKPYTSNWEAVNKEFMKHSRFGNLLSRESFLSDEVSQIKSKNLEGEALVLEAFQTVTNQIAWNFAQCLEQQSRQLCRYKLNSCNAASCFRC